MEIYDFRRSFEDYKAGWSAYKSVIRNSRNRDISNRYNGFNGEQLAREYGISVNQVRNIINKIDRFN